MQQANITKYFEQNADLRVLFVFDPLGDMLTEVESFTWSEPYQVIRFAGDWFATKCMLADLPAGKKVILLMEMRSPLGSEEEMHAFPLLGELCANALYSDDNYHAFLTVRGLPETMTQFVRVHWNDLQLAKFDKILSPVYGPAFNADMAARGMLSVLLGENSIREWRDIFARLFILDAEDSEESKKKTTFFSMFMKKDCRYQDVLDELQRELRRTFGAELDLNKERHLAACARRLRYNTVVQNLPEVAADNYKAMRETNGVVLNRMNQFLIYAAELPEKIRPAFFSAFESLSCEIHMAHLTDVYGAGADFGAYPPILCREILQALARDGVSKNAAAVRARALTISSRTDAGKRMVSVARFLGTAAEVYLALGRIKTFKLNTPTDYVLAYAGEWQAVDRGYRLAVESYYDIATDDDRQIVEGVKAALDQDYAFKTNDWNVAWMASLQSSGGREALGQFPLQENFARQIGDSTVKHVVIVSDGLRYEIVKEIEERVNSGRHKAALSPAIGMVPSETKYCKPVLLPHEVVQFINVEDCDVQLDGKWANSTALRQAILDYHWPGALCVDTKKLSQMTQNEKRTLFKNSLVYVYHDVVDDASHSNPGVEVVRACRRAVEELAQLIASLHSTYNVNDVWLVSDHGFLMNDIVFQDKDKIPVSAEENAVEKTSRYYLTDSATEIPGVAKFPLRSVSCLDSDLQVAVPLGTARFNAPGGYVYAHGGATLQEIVIPVLRSRFLRPDAREKVGVSLLQNGKLQVVSSQIKFKLLQDDVATSTVQGRTVVCALFDGDRMVTAEKKQVLDSTNADPNERVRLVELTLVSQTDKEHISSILQLRVWDESDPLNPLIQVPVANNTMVERDFD